MGAGRERPSRRWHADAVAAVAVLTYLVLASRAIAEPGLHVDEAVHLVPALSFVKGGLPTNALIATGPTFDIGRHSMSIMTFPLAGSLKNFAFIPVVALFGFGPESVRYFTIGVAALAMIATYAFARRLFRSEWVAAVGLVLLAVDPSFVFYTRVDFNHTAFMMLLKAVGAWQLLRWWDTRSNRSVALGAFALGLGLYDKSNFAWIIAAGVVATVAVAGRGLAKRITRRAIAVGVVGFLMGCLPLLFYNLRSGFGSLHWYGDVVRQFAPGSRSFFPDESVPSGGFPAQLFQRVKVLSDLLDGRSVSRLLTTPFSHEFTLLPILFVFAAVVICARLAIRRPYSREARAGVLALLFTLGVLVAAAATTGGFHGYHVILAYPFPHLALGLVIVQAARLVARRLPPARKSVGFASATAALAAVPVALALTTTLGMLDTFRGTGGRGLWSDRIYNLERYISDTHREERIVPVDVGLSLDLVGLSQGRLHVYEVNLQQNNPPPVEALSQALRDRRTWYVLHSKDATFVGAARRHFFAAINAAGARLHVVRRFRDREGRPLYEIYSVPGQPHIPHEIGRQSVRARQGS